MGWLEDRWRTALDGGRSGEGEVGNVIVRWRGGVERSCLIGRVVVVLRVRGNEAVESVEGDFRVLGPGERR